jgi:hypothetical protein
MDIGYLTHGQRQIRSIIRAFLMTATRDELHRELAISEERCDTFLADCIRELLEALD